MGSGSDSKGERGSDAQIQEETLAEIQNKLKREKIGLTEEQKRLLRELYDWQERSRETNWVLGEPLGVRT